MLLKKVKLQNGAGDILTLDIRNPVSGIIVREIEGIGPVKANLVSTSFADSDGAQFHTARRETRNILIDFGLSADLSTLSVYDLRKELYKYLMPKAEVKLLFELFDKFDPSVLTQNLNVEIDGIVESLEPVIFTQKPTVRASIICHVPDFVDPTVITFSGNTVADLTEVAVDYVGTSETGVLFTIYPDRTVDEFSIYHRTPSQQLKYLNFTVPIYASEELRIDSRFGQKSVTRLASGVESSALYGRSPQSMWLELEQGENNLRVYALGAAVPWDIVYTNKYGGL